MGSKWFEITITTTAYLVGDQLALDHLGLDIGRRVEEQQADEKEVKIDVKMVMMMTEKQPAAF